MKPILTDNTKESNIVRFTKMLRYVLICTSRIRGVLAIFGKDRNQVGIDNLFDSYYSLYVN